MTPETINNIKEALAPVAEKIGQGAEYGWEILVWGQFAEGVALLIIGATTATIYIVCGIGGFYYAKSAKEKDRFSDAMVYFVFIFGMASCVALPVIAISLYEGTLQTIAPEYAALKFLIGTVK